MHVYVSHSRVNSSAALQLCGELQKLDVKTWLDIRDLEPGADWDRGIPGFLKTGQVLVLAHTPTSSAEVAAKIVSALKDPASSLDEKRLDLGREARQRALDSFRQYSQVLREKGGLRVKACCPLSSIDKY